MLEVVGTPRQLASRVAHAVAVEHQLDASAVMGRQRGREVTVGRWACWTVLHDAGWGWSRIGRTWGMSHSTVRHGVRWFGAMCLQDSGQAAALGRVVRRVCR